MSDRIKVYGIEMDDFGFEEATKSFYHREGCTAQYKDRYSAGDKLVGVAHEESTDTNYIIYSCHICGGLYAVEGTVPDKIVKGI